MSEISVTRGLVKLKTLSRQIERMFGDGSPIVGVIVGEKPPTNFNSAEDFKVKAKSAFDSLTDLIKFRSDLKSAIVKSNAYTTVQVGNTTMTVAEAIERKQSIEIDKRFLTMLRNQYSNCQNTVDTENEDIDRQLERLVESSFGGKDKRVEKSDYDNIAKPFLAANERKLIDPLGIKAIIDKMMAMIDDFLENVDVALSESNAKTMINI
jgi:hypothetical protein